MHPRLHAHSERPRTRSAWDSRRRRSSPHLTGAILGIPGGLALIALISSDPATPPPLWWLLATVFGTVLVVGALTGIPARISARRGVAEILRSELA